METTRKKLIYRSYHRGTKEMDLIMGRFADAFIPTCNEHELKAYEDLLHENDPDLYNWITGREEVPARLENPTLNALISFSNNRKTQGTIKADKN